MDAESGTEGAFWQRNAIVFLREKHEPVYSFGESLDKFYQVRQLIDAELPYISHPFFKMATRLTAIEKSLKDSNVRYWGLSMIYIKDSKYTDIQAGCSVDQHCLVREERGGYQVIVMLE